MPKPRKVTIQGKEFSSIRQAARTLGLSKTTACRMVNNDAKGNTASQSGKKVWDETINKNSHTIECRATDRIKTWQDAVKHAGIDLDTWEVVETKVGVWDVTMKTLDGPETIQNKMIRVVLKRRIPQKTKAALDHMLAKIQRKSPKVPKLPRLMPRAPKRITRALEIDIMDPHIGMRCFTPGAEASWSPAKAARLMDMVVADLLEKSRWFGPYTEICLPIGNDWLHCDDVITHSTTAGTPQPEAEAWHNSFIFAEDLAMTLIDALKQLAPVRVFQIPGNHARQSEFSLGRVLRAAYHNDKNVTVYADSSPYKFWSFGVNLIGFEHGHSIPVTRLAAIMANETRQNHWQNARYCEWHLGDQHRKGSGKLVAMEEQGVSVEFLAALTPPNEWHKLKGFNWQSRAGTAYVWDAETGPVARLQCNIDSHTNKLMGK